MSREGKMTIEEAKGIIKKYLGKNYFGGSVIDQALRTLLEHSEGETELPPMDYQEKENYLMRLKPKPHKLNLTKDELIIIIRDNIKFSPYGLVNYTMMDSFEKIAEVIIEKNNER